MVESRKRIAERPAQSFKPDFIMYSEVADKSATLPRYALKLSHQPDHDALDRHFCRRNSERIKRSIRRLQTDYGTLRIEPFEGHLRIYQSHNHLTGLSLFSTHHDDKITIVDSLLDHRLSNDSQNVVFSWLTVQHMMGYSQRLVSGHRLNWASSGDHSKKGKFVHAVPVALPALLRELDSALLIPLTLEITFLFEKFQVLVYRAVR